jgi:hypothetical protein
MSVIVIEAGINNMKNIKSIVIGLYLGIAALGMTAGSSQATVLLQIVRVSDTQGVLTGSGTVDPGPVPGNANILTLLDPFATFTETTGVCVNSATTGTLLNGAIGCGSQQPPSGNAVPGSGLPTLDIRGASNMTVGFVLGTGSVTFDLLNGFTFDSIGTTGSVHWGFQVAGPVVGTWEIVSGETITVAEPGMVALFAIGLAGLGFARRKRSA